MKDLVPFYKSIGKTPLQCVEKFKQTNPEFKDVTVSYAGRLDPMAEGIILLLVGEANKKRREYEHWDKEYEVGILCGVATDTGDLLGIITQIQNAKFKVQKEQIIKTLHNLVGEFEQRYPAYSSVRVNGKPLYWWARQGRLHEITIPTHQVKIHSIKYLSTTTITALALLVHIQTTIAHVQGDFRQSDIIANWQYTLTDCSNVEFQIIHIKVSCGSGVYMRILAEDIGKRLGFPACAFAIKRTRVGTYTSTIADENIPQSKSSL